MTPDLRACLDSALSAIEPATVRGLVVAALLPTLEAREQALRDELTAANVAYARLAGKHVVMVGEEHEARLAAESALADLRARVRAVSRAENCWCEAGIGNPMMRGHSTACQALRALLRDAPAPVTPTEQE